MKKRSSEEQFINVLKEQDAGFLVKGDHPPSRYSGADLLSLESKFGGMEASDAKRLRELEPENAKLEKLLAEQKLDNAALKDVISQKW